MSYFGAFGFAAELTTVFSWRNAGRTVEGRLHLNTKEEYKIVVLSRLAEQEHADPEHAAYIRQVTKKRRRFLQPIRKGFSGTHVPNTSDTNEAAIDMPEWVVPILRLFQSSFRRYFSASNCSRCFDGFVSLSLRMFCNFHCTAGNFWTSSKP